MLADRFFQNFVALGNLGIVGKPKLVIFFLTEFLINALVVASSQCQMTTMVSYSNHTTASEFSNLDHKLHLAQSEFPTQIYTLELHQDVSQMYSKEAK